MASYIKIVIVYRFQKVYPKNRRSHMIYIELPLPVFNFVVRTFVLIFIAGVIFLIFFLRKKIKEWRINR